MTQDVDLLDDELDEIEETEIVDQIAAEDELASEENQNLSNNTVDEEKVQKVFEMLAADFRRIQSPLPEKLINRLIIKKCLSPYEILELRIRLQSNSIEVEEENDDLDETQDATISTKKEKVTKGLSSDGINFLLSQKDSKRILTKPEELELGQAILIAQKIEKDLSKDQLSTNEEAQRILAKGKQAKDKLILQNLRLVLKVVNKYNKRCKSLEQGDLFQMGVMGLISATEKFDPYLGFKFSTYATWWIEQSIARGIDDTESLIRIPVHRLEQIRKFRRTKYALSIEFGRDPHIYEIAESMELPLDLVSFLHTLTYMGITGLEVTNNDEDEASIERIIPCNGPNPEQILSAKTKAEKVEQLVNTLTEKEKTIVSRRFGMNVSKNHETLQEIGETYGVTRERIRQIQKKAMTKLKFRVRKTQLKQEMEL